MNIRDLVHVPLAVGKQLAECVEQSAAQRRVLPDQRLVRRDHVLDHFIEPGQQRPRVTVGIQAHDIVGLFSVVEELVEQHYRVSVAAPQDIEQRLLRAGHPFQARGIDRVCVLQQVL